MTWSSRRKKLILIEWLKSSSDHSCQIYNCQSYGPWFGEIQFVVRLDLKFCFHRFKVDPSYLADTMDYNQMFWLSF